VRTVVTVRVPALAGRRSHQIELHNGDSATFGPCLCGRCGLDLALDEDAPWFVGEITATTGHWLLTNLCPSQALLVENLENSYEYLTVDPGRHLAPVAFELSRVGPADGLRGPELTVFGPEPQQAHARPAPCSAVRKPRATLNPRATYYAVLRALCEPRLRGAASAPLPTSDEIAHSLGSRMNARAVDGHIEYVTGKLGLERGCGRDVLVATAIRRRLVSI
jgi:hypothetical protein